MTYTPTGAPSDGTRPISRTIRNEFRLIGEAFSILPERRRNNNRLVFVSGDETKLEARDAKDARRLLGYEEVISAAKSADEEKASTTSIGADPDLQLLLAPNSTYDICLPILIKQTSGTGGISLEADLSFSGTSDFIIFDQGDWVECDDSRISIRVLRGVVATVTSGTLSFRWTAGTSGSVTLYKRSLLYARKRND